MDTTNVIENKFTQNLQNKIGAPVCPMCQRNQFALAPNTFALLELKANRVDVSADNILPIIAASCGHCGYVMLFAAKTLGL